MKTKKGIAIIIMIVVSMLVMTITAVCEQTAWDCPECGRTGNIGNFCGGCGHPAPTNDEGSSDRTGKKNPEVGDIITFGTYPQTSEGSDQTPIEWIVLDVQDGKALLLSKYGLDAKQYNNDSKWTGTTWEKCDLRSWLNTDFLENAFSEKEQTTILVTDVDNSSNQGYSEWNTTGGSNTKDKLFLLSYTEASRYLNITHNNRNNIKSRVSPTAYAKKRGAFTNPSFKTNDDKSAGWWWLRSPGYFQHSAASVNDDGSFYYLDVGSSFAVVRPALWINLESDVF